MSLLGCSENLGNLQERPALEQGPQGAWRAPPPPGLPLWAALKTTPRPSYQVEGEGLGGWGEAGGDSGGGKSSTGPRWLTCDRQVWPAKSFLWIFKI